MAESTRGKARRARSDEADGRPTGEEEADEREDGAEDEPEGQPEGDASEALSAKELADAARGTVADLTGYEPESVTGLEWDGESWLVTVDVLELERIPNTTDVIAAYVVQLDSGGVLLGYKRAGRFVRGQVGGD